MSHSPQQFNATVLLNDTLIKNGVLPLCRTAYVFENIHGCMLSCTKLYTSLNRDKQIITKCIIIFIRMHLPLC